MSEMRAYTWKPRTSFAIDVQKAGEELDRLKGHNSGELTPEAVVDAARNPKNPLHSAFEWDDAKAAQEHRLQTAGLLIRSIVVTVTASDQSPTQVNLKVTATPGSGGTSTARIIPPEELHRAKVEKGWREIDAWRTTYGELPEFIGISMALSGFLSTRAVPVKSVKKSAAA